jgi:uncharacterized pyridoxal phosphate-containing UPF0001 family protein
VRRPGKSGQDVLLEVNIGEEEAKSGFLPADLFAAARAAEERTHIRVRGLMTVPPVAPEEPAACLILKKSAPLC